MNGWISSRSDRNSLTACVCSDPTEASGSGRDRFEAWRVIVKIRRVLAAAGVGLVVAGAASAALGGAKTDTALDRRLVEQAATESKILSDHFAKAKIEILKASQNPAFATFYSLPGTREERIAAGGPVIQAMQAQMKDLEGLFPDGIVSEVCFIHGAGAENARIVGDHVALASELSLDETVSPFFAETLSTKPGDVFQARPYISPDTKQWVVSNSTLLPVGDRNALLHFEVSLESFRKLMTGPGLQDAIVIERSSGNVILDFDHEIKGSGPLESADEPSYEGLQRTQEVGAPVTLNGERLAFHRVAGGPSNANDWILVTKAKASGPTIPLIVSIGAAVAGLVLLLLSLVVGRRTPSGAVLTRDDRELVGMR
jgi:hypothetical protein